MLSQSDDITALAAAPAAPNLPAGVNPEPIATPTERTWSLQLDARALQFQAVSFHNRNDVGVTCAFDDVGGNAHCGPPPGSRKIAKFSRTPFNAPGSTPAPSPDTSPAHCTPPAPRRMAALRPAARGP